MTDDLPSTLRDASDALAAVIAERDALAESKNTAYRERDELVALISKLYPSHLAQHEGDEWDDEWWMIVCVHTPAGQAAWHVHWQTEYALFAHLAERPTDWDGHTTEQKYDRLRSLTQKPDADLLAAVIAERDELRAALRRARDDMEGWGAYADSHFREKWDLAGDLKAIDDALANGANDDR